MEKRHQGDPKKTSFTKFFTRHNLAFFSPVDHVSIKLNLSVLQKKPTTNEVWRLSPYKGRYESVESLVLFNGVGKKMENCCPFVGLGTITVLTPGVLIDKALRNTSCPCMTEKFAYNSQCKLCYGRKSPARYQFTINNDFGAVHNFIG